MVMTGGGFIVVIPCHTHITNTNGNDKKEPIDWRYTFHIYTAYFSRLSKEISPQHIVLSYMVQYPILVLEFLLM